MKSLICPTCGCSLVRLGVSREGAARAEYEGTEHPLLLRGLPGPLRIRPRPVPGGDPGRRRVPGLPGRETDRRHRGDRAQRDNRPSLPLPRLLEPVSS
jgi:hypothetical protein